MESITTELMTLLGGSGDFGTGGVMVNVKILLIAWPFSVLGGFLFAALRVVPIRAIRVLADVIVDAIKAVPLLLGVFWFYYFLPILLGDNVSALMSGVVALVVLSAAHMSEGFRSGWRVIGREQLWSARLSGLNRIQTMCAVVAPQALITMLPAVFTQTISLFKDSAVVFVIGVMELTQTGMAMANRTPDRLLTIYFVIGLYYFAVCGSMSFVFRRIEDKLAVRRSVLCN